jgi:lysylphosphatidylglycerol synthase-like protein
MIALSYKSKQYGLIALKVLILMGTFGYIYLKIVQNESISFSEFIVAIRNRQSSLILLFFGLAAANWFFEILKWQTVISPVKKLSLTEATRQSLAALTVSLPTPNRIGEYGAKAFFFAPDKRKKVLLLNFYSNITQMGITCIFGFYGLVYVTANFGLSISVANSLIVILALMIFGITGYIFKEKELLIKDLSIGKILRYTKNLPIEIRVKTILYSLLRYIIFSSLFYLLLNFFEAKIDVSEAMPIILAMYLLASVIPTIFIFDVVIRGGIAVWLFSLAGIPEWPVLCTVLAMWLLNFVIPAVWGSFYVVIHRHS